MKKRRVIFLTYIVLAIVINFVFDLSTELFNFLLTTIMLVSEVIELWKFRQISRINNTIQVKTYKWFGGLAISGFIISFFANASMSAWNILAIIGMILFAILYILRNLNLTFSIEEKGIRNLNNGDFISANAIANIKINNRQLTIDTASYQNELVIASSNLKSPSWNELTLLLRSKYPVK